MDDSIRRYFIEAARTAARMARAGPAAEQGRSVDDVGIFVVSSADPLLGYQWEVRKQDGIVLERSIETYRTTLLARYAGLQALAEG